MSLHRDDWMKIIGGLALAATGAGLAGAGPLAGALSSGAAAGAGAAGAAGAGAGGSGFASLVAPSLISTGVGTGLSGAMGTPSSKTVTPGQLPSMNQNSDPFDILRQIQSMKQGGF